MDDEYNTITSVLNAFFSFHKYEFERVLSPKSIKYNSLSAEEKLLLPWFPSLLRDLTQCIEINQAFTEALANTSAHDWGVPFDPSNWAEPTASEYDKVRSTLLQMCREWSSDGIEERKLTYGKIIDKACDLISESERKSAKVLVPGCGLGRLVYEFVKHGFWTQGNEVSYHMLLALGFILNHMNLAHSHTIFPYIHKLSNLTRRLFQVRPVSIPDENPLSIFGETQKEMEEKAQLMSMVAGSFVDLYGPQGLDLSDAYTGDESAKEFRDQNSAAFDIVATSFFLDTAHNIIDYLKTIHHCLKKGGKWINIGPTYWHFEDDLSTHMVKKVMEPGAKSISVQTIMGGLELSRDELLLLIEKIGFHIIQHSEGIRTTYSSDVRASSKFVYECDFWVAEKV